MADIPNGFGPVSAGSAVYQNYGMWIGFWAPSAGFIVQPDLQEYNFTTTEFQVWNDLYLNLANINNLQVSATAAGASQANYEAIAMIMKAYDFQQLVDNYNDVPYSEVFNSAILTPKYDKGAAIYADLLVQLDKAIALINANPHAVSPANADIIFGGNMTGWKKFANSLKLRLVMRQSNLPIFTSLKAELASTASEGYLDGTTQALAQPGYTSNDAYGGQESPFYHSYGFTQTGNPTGSNTFTKANTYSVNLLESLGDPSIGGDPRLPYIYQPLANGNVVGVYVGDPNINNISGSAISAIGPGLLKSATQPAVVFSGAESLFLQAEAVEDGMITGDANALYDAGITASFEALNVGGTASTADAAAAAYYAQPSVALATAYGGNTEEAIIMQKYISLNGYGPLEAYNEWRRTGYPSATDVRSQDQTALGAPNQIPSRIFYPQTEYDTNSTNVAAEGTINAFTSLIFWAKY
jgi:hypothetical protein